MPTSSLVASAALAEHWYVVAESVAVVDAPVAVTLLGRRLVLWRDPSGSVVVAPDRCPHREAPLSLGQVEHGRLTCEYHGWAFGEGGRCVAVPSVGPGRAVPPTAHLPTLCCVERYGLVWVCPGAPSGDVPAVTCEDDPAYRRINSGVEVWKTSALRMTDNFLDVAHFSYVHAATLGAGAEVSRASPRASERSGSVPTFTIGALDDDFVGYRYDVEVGNDVAAGAAASQLDSPVVRRRMTTGFALPFTVRSTIRYESGLDHIILLCTTPIDDERSLFTFVVWRNDSGTGDDEDVIAFDRAIGAEDKRMLEQVPGALPLDVTATVNVRSDRASVEWRRRLAALLADP